ncbi:MAG: hypothetical protein QNJ22_21895 [Desulfosarcinaceae bacterium]|nr:hypothetical protein [Desulfosarcinaceae bacterium]
MKVDHLTRVQVDLTVGHQSDEMDLVSEPVAWSFVAGAGADGLTPFEMACFRKSPGDEFCVEIPARQPHKVFEHLRPPVFRDLFDDRPIFVKTVVTRVASASSREVVQAMAEATHHGEGGCGGGCDCGCG